MLVSPKVGVAEGEDGAFLVHALSHNELEVAVLVLGDAQIGHGAQMGVELGQVAAASLAVEHRHDLHGRLLGGDGRVAGAGVADHLHMHIVPRWNGDNNFMPVLADIRCVPEALEVTAELLRHHWPEA